MWMRESHCSILSLIVLCPFILLLLRTILVIKLFSTGRNRCGSGYIECSYFPNCIYPNPLCRLTLWETGAPGENPRLWQSVDRLFYNKHTCREVSLGLDAPNLQVCLVFITCHFGKILKSTEEFYTHLLFSI
jgi:hypothetical protein